MSMTRTLRMAVIALTVLAMPATQSMAASASAAVVLPCFDSRYPRATHQG